MSDDATPDAAATPGGDASPAPDATDPATADRGGDQETPPAVEQPFGLPRWVSGALPLVLLAVLVAGFLLTSPLAGLQTGQPLPDVAVTHVTLAQDHESMTLHVVNSGPPVTGEQVLVDEAYWSWEMASGDGYLATMESNRILVPYHWEPGWDLEVALVLASGATVHHTIVAPHASPGTTGRILDLLAGMGVLVGVVPVALGMLWFPYIRGMSKRRLHAVLAFSAGILGFLAVDAAIEAVEFAREVSSAFDGLAVGFLGAAGALLLVQSVGAWREDRDGGAVGLPRGLWVAYLVALGIGLHNLAEGLAIGSSFALGRVSLGAFLVVGFMVHNVTEGPAVVAPLAERRRPHWKHFVSLGALAGAPVVLGGWIGGLAFSPLLGTLFLAVGVGAILQVLVELVGLVREDGGRVGSATNLLAFLAGLVVMYATDLLVTL